MNDVMDAMASEFSATNLWGAIEPVLPVLGITTLFALTFYLLKRIINKAKKAKGGV